MSIKEQSKRANSESLKEKNFDPYVVPETTIRDLVVNLRIGEAHDAAMCLLVIGEAVQAIVRGRTKSRELNLRLIRQLADGEQCRPVKRISEAIIVAIGQGAEGIHAIGLTITRFLEFAFEYQPDHGMASRLYKQKLSTIKRATRSSK